MKETIAFQIYNADDEDPKCSRCSNVNADEEYCSTHCGPEHCWNGYERAVRKIKEKEVGAL